MRFAMVDSRIGWRALGLAIGLALMLLVLSQSTRYLQQLAAGWDGRAWPLLLLAVLAAVLVQLLFGSAWHVLVGNGASGGWRMDLACWSVSLVGKYLPGQIFHGAMRIGAYHGTATAGSRVAAGFLRETLLSLGAASTWVAVHVAVSNAAPRVLTWPMSAAAVALTLAAVLPLPARVLARLTRWHAPADAALAPAPAARSALAWLLQAAGYLGYGVALWLLARALAPGHAPGLFAVTAAFCFAGVAGVAAFMVPAGIGVREAALAWYLTAWLPAGSAALLAIAARLCLSLAEAIAIAFGLMLLRAARR